MQTAEAWNSGRPCYSRLPGVNGGYRDEDEPSPADWLTVFFDELLVSTKATVDDLPRQLDPDLCDANWLDFLGILCGFTGEYWEKNFPEAVKRDLCREAYRSIWPNKGSRAVLEYLLDLFAIAHTIWLGSQFVAGVTILPGVIGAPGWRYFVLLPLAYLRESVEFRRAEWINRLYGPAFAESRVCFEQFYAGFSVCGDPCFEGV